MVGIIYRCRDKAASTESSIEPLYGTLITAGVYVLCNASYYIVLTPEEMRHSEAVAAFAIDKAYGDRQLDIWLWH